MGTERTRSAPELELEALAATVISVLFAGIAFGAVLHGTGRIESVAGLYGVSGTVEGWLIQLAHSFLAGAGFAVLASIVSPARLASRFGIEHSIGAILASVVLGIVFGAVLWIVVVALGVPLWMDFVVGADRPFPYLHQLSLAGLVIFGATFATCFTIVREYVAVDTPVQTDSHRVH